MRVTCLLHTIDCIPPVHMDDRRMRVKLGRLAASRLDFGAVAEHGERLVSVASVNNCGPVGGGVMYSAAHLISPHRIQVQQPNHRKLPRVFLPRPERMAAGCGLAKFSCLSRSPRLSCREQFCRASAYPSRRGYCFDVPFSIPTGFCGKIVLPRLCLWSATITQVV